MESEGDNLEPTSSGQSPDDPEHQSVRVKRRRRRSKPQSIEVSLPPIPPKKKRDKSVFKSPVFWAAMNFVTAAVTYMSVKWPAMQVATEIPVLKPPPPSKHTESASQQHEPLNQPGHANEPVEEVTPRPSSPAVGSKPAFASFYGKKEPAATEADASSTSGLTEGVTVPKDFQPQSLPMQQPDGEESGQLQKGASPAKAELVKAAKYRDAGDLDRSLDCYREAVRMDPKSSEAAYGLGLALDMKRQTEEAVVFYLKALRLSPDYIAPLVSLAWLSATHPNPAYRNGTRAVGYAERARKITEDMGTLDTLAAAYAEAGRFNEAVETAQKAVSLARKPEEQVLVDDIQKRIELYKSGKPYRAAK